MKTDSIVPAPNLLIVDDSPANLELLVRIFQDQGFRARPVASGELALQAAQSEPPDLVLLDINMPGMDGYEVCRRLKEDAILKAVPVIFISAMDGVIDKVKAFSAGGVDHIAKPFHMEEVESRVRTHLELARLRRDLEDLVAHRTRELAQANARLAILDKAKSDFLTLISHEIRTPLNGVFGAAELLLMTYEGQPDTASYAKLYEVSRRRLMTLVDDALLLTEVGLSSEDDASSTGRLEEMLNDARAAAGPFAESRGVQIAPVPATPSIVQGTPDYLARALQSLLETALKFARASTTVGLAQTTTPDEIHLCIEAQGQTIPTTMLPHFFDLLTTAEPILGVEDLDLAPPLAERILTLYGGTVSAENLDPPGIRLRVRLKTAGAVPPAG